MLQCFRLLEVSPEIEDHLDWFAGLEIVVLAIHVKFGLTAIAKHLLTSLLEGYSHMLAGCSSHVLPERELRTIALNLCDMFHAYPTTLRIGDTFLPQGPGNLFFQFMVGREHPHPSVSVASVITPRTFASISRLWE